ncbi:MAG: DUF262 domain-containing protein, partial [Acetatifactor sp.]
MELIFSVKKLFAEYLKSGEHFTIPAYQRGYKWKITDIEQLLDDIDDYSGINVPLVAVCNVPP